MISTRTQNKNNFTILSTNIQSLRATFDELYIFIEHLRTLNLEFSAICTQECCIFDNDDRQQIELKGYKLISQSKYQCSSKGGLTIHLHEKFDYEYKFKLNKYKTWKFQVIQVKLRNNSTS